MLPIAGLAALACLPLRSEHKKIVVTGLGTAIVADLRAAAPGATLVAAEPGEDLTRHLGDADGFLGTITPDLLRAAKKLKWVHSYSAGVEAYLFPGLVNSDVVLTNARIIQGPQIADHAFAMLLMLTRDLHRAVPNRIKEEWAPKERYQGIELPGKTAVIVGVGGIGFQIAQRAHGFGMTVIGVDPEDKPHSVYVSRMVPPEKLDDVLPLADVVFVAAPHTPRTEGMFRTGQFDRMKRGAYFIAVSRGKLTDTNALVRALDEKRLAGAGVDVTDPEPLPKGHPLWKFDNVIITQHVATVSDRLMDRQRELLLENVARFSRGQPLRNVVDKRKGY
ncbi:MAG: D-2-hydroxyacid dehydrogenase [Bryobacteraceae bacterium]